MKRTVGICLLAGIWFGGSGLHAATNHYLYVGHPREDNNLPGVAQLVQREVERVDYAHYDRLLLGGDYTWNGTGSRGTVDYLDAVFDLAGSNTLAALGNHDTGNKSFFTDVTGRPTYYTYDAEGITFAVLDTTDDSQNILGGELQMLQDTVNFGLSNSTHLILVHHHFIWLADYPPLASLIGDVRIGASSRNLSGKNFHSTVYPLLQQAKSNGVEVICVGGDRTGYEVPGANYGEFHIEHTTADGIHFLAAGLMEELPANLRTVIEFTHDTGSGALTWSFQPLSALPRIPDESLVITELHYDPTPDNSRAFIEVMNRGDTPYDLSGATFVAGMNNGDFTFPANTILVPGERVLIASSSNHYGGLSVRVFDYPGSDKLNSDEPIWLRDAAGLEVDYVNYGIAAPWPSEPDNTGPSLVLIQPDEDNERPECWGVSDLVGGSPGAPNFAPPGGVGILYDTDRAFTTWAGTVSNASYRLEWTPSLTTPNWQPVATSITAQTSSLLLMHTNAAPRGYYRLGREFTR